MINNNPLRCAAEGCAFYSVTFGGYCEECDDAAHAMATPVAELMWMDENAIRMEREAMEHFWQTVD